MVNSVKNTNQMINKLRWDGIAYPLDKLTTAEKKVYKYVDLIKENWFNRTITTKEAKKMLDCIRSVYYIGDKPTVRVLKLGNLKDSDLTCEWSKVIEKIDNSRNYCNSLGGNFYCYSEFYHKKNLNMYQLVTFAVDGGSSDYSEFLAEESSGYANHFGVTLMGTEIDPVNGVSDAGLYK